MSEPITLYVVPASHPCIAVETALQLKQLEYRRVDLMFGVSNITQMLRFRGRTVPGLTIGSRTVHGSRAILRALDELAPDPSLLPADPGQRAAVDQADEWGDLVLQEHTRWIALTAAGNKPAALRSFFDGYRLPKPPVWALKHARLAIGAEGRLLGHTPRRIRDEYLPGLPSLIDHADQLIAEGVIGGPEPNVADLQIASSIRLLLNLEDLREAIEPRPCAQLARRLIPTYAGTIPSGAINSPF